MGLDMYLNKNVYVGANYSHRKVKGKIDLTAEGKPIKVDLSKVTYITEAGAYWRKVNHIHKWFVDNVQNGVDDCGTYYVTTEKLKELIGICKKILNFKSDVLREEAARDLLPPQEGFFFGGTDIDTYYYGSLAETIAMIEPLLLDEDAEFEYHASW